MIEFQAESIAQDFLFAASFHSSQESATYLLSETEPYKAAVQSALLSPREAKPVAWRRARAGGTFSGYW